MPPPLLVDVLVDVLVLVLVLVDVDVLVLVDEDELDALPPNPVDDESLLPQPNVVVAAPLRTSSKAMKTLFAWFIRIPPGDRGRPRADTRSLNRRLSEPPPTNTILSPGDVGPARGRAGAHLVADQRA
jgi:hypothetical protein